jgi:hypothetical protein
VRRLDAAFFPRFIPGSWLAEQPWSPSWSAWISRLQGGVEPPHSKALRASGPRLHVHVNQRDQLKGFENIILRGLAWGAAKGTSAALRLADDVPGAGQGFGLF